MLTTTTPCRITKEGDKFMASFDEFPEFEPLVFDNIEYLLEIASVYLALCMITNDREFQPHTKPLTPPDNLGPKDIFSLVVVDIEQVLDILNAENVGPSQMLEWILNDSAGPKHINVSTEETEPVTEQKENSKTEPPITDDEFDEIFAGETKSEETSPSPDIPSSTTSEISPEPAEETSSLLDKVEAINKEREKAKDIFVAPDEDDEGINFVSKDNKPEQPKKPEYKPKRQPPKNNKNKYKNKYNKNNQNKSNNNNNNTNGKNPAN